ncbi:MAG: alpha/beta fold hydrolase [Gammaproteobacteria bacterium]|nr:alpha/beta fold hydrolase [Gammaproteobacteria bacterium]
MRRHFFSNFLVLLAALLGSGSLCANNISRVEKGSLVLEDIPEIDSRTWNRLARYLETRSTTLADWTHDGALLVRTRFKDTDQFHVITEPLGARRQITFFPEPVFGGTVNANPKAGGFLFSKDVGGNEQNQIFYYDFATGHARLLSDGASRNGAPVWSKRGDKFAYFSTRRDGVNSDIYMGWTDAITPSAMIFKTDGAWVPLDWSPDDTKLLLWNYFSINESRLFIADIDTGEIVQVNPREEKQIGYWDAMFSADGEGVYLSSDEDSEFKQLRYYDLASQEMRSLSGDISWDVDTFELSRNGRWLAYVTNQGGISKLYLHNLQEDKRVRGPEFPMGVISSIRFSHDSKNLAVALSTSQSPGDIFVYKLRSNELTRWTRSETGGLDSARFVEPELIEYPTFDQVDGKPRRIPAFVYRPLEQNGSTPVVIRIHGGPESQYRPIFSSLTQYFVNEMGATVIAPNVRGSSGYGKSYLRLDNGLKREDSVKDIGALLDWIASRPELDEKRVMVYGGSYGGYMALASAVHYNNRLRGAINFVGISNFVTFLQNTKPYRRTLRRSEYGDERIPAMREFLVSISPSTHAHKITQPLLTVQGLNDPRVPASESEQIVTTIRDNGGEVWYLMAKDEGHSFKKKSNRDYYYATVVEFLKKFL